MNRATGIVALTLTCIAFGCAGPTTVPSDGNSSAACPKPSHVVRPLYPRKVIKAGVTHGNVEMALDISTAGVPANVRVLKSNPEGLFDLTATFAVKQWRFNVTREYRDCLVDIDFRLTD